MFDYKKKFFLKLSFMLLLTLLLGFWSTCYADSYKDWTVADLKNCFYNIGMYKEMNENDVIQQIEDFNEDIETMVISMNNNSNVFMSVETGSPGNAVIEIYCNNEETIHPYWYSNRITNWGTAKNKTTRNTFNLGNGTHNNTTSISSTYAFNYSDVVYTTNDIYNSSNGNTVITSRGYIPSDLFEGYYQNIVWQFSPTSNSQTVTINGGNQWQYHAITGGWNIYLGSITDSEWVEKIQYRVGYWNNTLNQFSPVSSSTYTIYDYSKNGPLYKYWTSTNNNGVYTTGIYLDTYKFQNCILQLVITSQQPNELTTIYYDYLITNSKTYINGGIFYPNLTFSGDYVQDYNNQTETNQQEDNTNNIIDSINDINDDSQVDDILNGYFSGDYNDMANQWGFNPFQNPYYDFLKSVLFGICDVLADQRNVTLDISFFGRSIILHSEDFITPNNLITQFVRYVLIFFYIYGCFKFFYSVIISFETADIETIKQKIGTDEFYYKDGKYM